jgi:hypothetical protein
LSGVDESVNRMADSFLVSSPNGWRVFVRRCGERLVASLFSPAPGAPTELLFFCEAALDEAC